MEVVVGIVVAVAAVGPARFQSQIVVGIVDEAVAVVVEVVANLGCRGVDRVQRIVAVVAAFGEGGRCLTGLE